MSPPKYSLLAIPALLALCAISVDMMHLQPRRSGAWAVVENLVRNPAQRFFPDTKRLILREYTGVTKLDEILVLLNVVFANTGDWTRPAFTLYNLHFLGQAVPLFVPLFLEALRSSSSWGLIGAPWVLIWGMAIQLAGVTCIIPIWAIVHLYTTSNRARPVDSVFLSDPAQARALIPGYIIGFLLPSALGGVPFEDATHGQYVNVVWQFFPVWVVLVSYVVSFFNKRTSVGAGAHVSPAERDRAALKKLYGFAITVGAVTQWFVVGVLLAAQYAPEVFPKGVAQHLSFGEVFVPTDFHSNNKFTAMSQVVHDMFRYDQYLGAASLTVWALVLSAQQGASGVGVGTIFGLVKDVVLVGPGGAMLKLVQARDDTLLAQADGGKKQQKSKKNR